MSRLSDLIFMAANEDLADQSKLPETSIELPCIFSGTDSIDYKNAEKKLADELLKAGIGLDAGETKETLTWLVNGKFRGDLKELIDLALHMPSGLGGSLLHGVMNIKQDIEELPSTGIDIQNIYKNPILQQDRKTLIALLGNGSFARALIVYANINGVPLEQGHIDFLKKQLANDELDIDKSVEAGKSQLRKKYSDKYDKIIEGLNKNCG
ncbi:MAG: hypothetical protein EPN21_10110 [Methylococcaceae bacterium]|nr:MAG: hypothetical protein EPN21_10110 [Methylococcaceae bacterium]